MSVRARAAVVTLLAGIVSCAFAVPAAATPTDAGLDQAAVDDYVADYLNRNGLPGASIAVVRNGKVVHTAGFGQDGHGRPVTPRTPMALGSVSKSVTAFAVLQLVDAGTVDLDEPVVSYLPRFAVDDPRGSQVTVRHLLSHTSGLPNPTIVPPADDLAEAVERTHGWQLTADPGTHYFYSNANYWVAARLVEVVSGKPYAGYLDEHVFTPLGMNHTRGVTTTAANVAGLTGGHVTAYGTALPLREMDTMSAGAGGVVSTAQDMARWMAMQTNDGVAPSGRVLLSGKLVRESRSPQPHADGYGLGWDRSGPGITPKRVSHSGQLSRYTAQQDLVPGSGYGVVVMLNSFTPTLEHPYEISSGIIDITEGGAPTPGLPVPTMIDGVLGLVTLGVVALAIRGLRRSPTWARRRARWRAWLFGLRLLPQLVAPALVVLLFLVVPALEDNTATPVDVFGLWPALTILLLTLGVTGIVLSAARVTERLRKRSQHRPAATTRPAETQ